VKLTLHLHRPTHAYFIVSNDKAVVSHLTSILESKYGALTFQKEHISYLNMAIVQNLETYNITVNQSNYINKLVDKYDLTVDSRIKYPSTANIFKRSSDESPTDKKMFVSLLMSLMYAGLRTRPDILCVICFLSTKATNPTIEDMNKLLYVTYYTINTSYLGLYFTKSGTNLVAYADSSHLTHTDAHGHSGVVVSIGCNPPVVVLSKKQSITSRSSTQSIEGTWLRAIKSYTNLKELFISTCASIIQKKSSATKKSH